MAQECISSSQKILIMAFNKLSALVVEDEASIRAELIRALNETIEIKVIGESDNVVGAFNLIRTTPADVLFLDIMLIGGSALQLLALLKRENVPIPPIVVNTGSRDFELAQKLHNEYRTEIISILKKPFYEDWEKHQELILESIYLQQQKKRQKEAFSGAEKKLLSFQEGKQSFVVNSDDILMVKTGAKGQGKTEIILENKTISFNLSLAQTLAKLPPNFIQINRFESININWISLLNHSEKEVTLRNGITSVIGNGYYQELCKII